MIYPYECEECEHRFEIIKSVSQIDQPELCPLCGSVSKRYISEHQSFNGEDDWDNATYCPVVGQEVKSNKHRRQIAKKRGWNEVGTENIDKITKKKQDELSKEREVQYDNAAKHAYNAM